MPPPGETAALSSVPGEAAVATLMEAMDWAATPLGPREQWPQSLRSAVTLILESRYPMMVAWGQDLIQFYNDALRPILGASKHPSALGAPAAETWPEAYGLIGPLMHGVMDSGVAVSNGNLLVPLDRFGFLEETHFDHSYSPIRDETGSVAGVLVTCQEMTTQVLGERRLGILRDLAAGTAEARTAEEACRIAAATLATAQADLPFALLYLLDAEGRNARLAGVSGLPAGLPASPETASLAATVDQASNGCWPLGSVVESGQTITLLDLARRFGVLPVAAAPPWDAPPWTAAPQSAVLLPLARPGQGRAVGVVVAGVSPRLALDQPYRDFMDLLAGQITSAIANARAYEEERGRAEALAELDRAKTVFFSNVSHEFRTPLTLLLGPLQDLLAGTAGELPSAAREQLLLAQRNAGRLLRLVNTLLDFSRIEAGRMQAVFEPTDLAALSADLASVFRSAVERAGLRLNIDCPPLPQPVYVDRELWEKIVLNLLSNALKFTFAGEIDVRLAWQGDHATLTVRDTGVGIPADELPRLFERFHRIQGTRGRSAEGTGIGLALVQELVRLHGGTVTVESTPGKGTAFRISVPAGSAHLPSDRIEAPRGAASTAIGAAPFVEEALRWLPDDTDSNPAPAPESESLPWQAAPPAVPAVHAARILIADDNADMRAYLQRLLGRRWRVEAVADGAAALAAARRQTPDLVLADVMMPGMDGFALLRALRTDEATRQAPVLLLSARAGEEASVEGLRAGADDYLVKPFSARELLARVSAHLELARLRAEAARREQALRREAEQAREAAEGERQRLFDLFIEAPAIICLLQGPEHRFVFANPRYWQVVGKRNPIGLSVREALPEIAAQGFLKLLDRVFASGQPAYGAEQLVLLDRNGTGALEQAYFDFIYQPTHGEDGRVDGIFVHAVEVTQQVRARQETERLAEANARLLRETKAALGERDAFIAAITHDLKSPLTSITGVVQLLERRAQSADTVESGPLRQGLGIIAGAGARMLAMVSELVDLARLQSGQPPELDRSTFDLVVAARHCVAEIQQTARRHTLTVAAQTDAVVGRWDRPRIERVITNMLSNAVKYSPDGGTIGVSVGTEDRQGAGWAVLRVSDQGAGIPRAELPHVFDRFYRGSNVSGHVAGAGIGLAGAKQIVELHGGTIEVESREGEGSTFTVRLPREE